MSVPGFQFDLVIRPALGSHAPGRVQWMESRFDTPLHLRFSRIAIFYIDLSWLKLIQEYLVGRRGQKSRQRHLRSVLRQGSLLLFGNEIQNVGHDMLKA